MTKIIYRGLTCAQKTEYTAKFCYFGHEILPISLYQGYPCSNNILGLYKWSINILALNMLPMHCVLWLM